MKTKNMTHCLYPGNKFTFSYECHNILFRKQDLFGEQVILFLIKYEQICRVKCRDHRAQNCIRGRPLDTLLLTSAGDVCPSDHSQRHCRLNPMKYSLLHSALAPGSDPTSQVARSIYRSATNGLVTQTHTHRHIYIHTRRWFVRWKPGEHLCG